MTTTAQKMRAWTGPTIFSFGFRPFFLLAGLWALLAMVIWIATVSGLVSLPSVFDPISWHAHEMLFGYLSAVLAGFLMTAVPNWTGRMPIVGWPLAALAALWLAGRIAVAFLGAVPVLAALIDLAFPVAFALAMGREILAGKAWRNLPVLGLLSLFILADAVFYYQAMQGGFAARGVGFRFGLAVAIMFISLIGGRIVPSFTRNWLAQRKSTVLPKPFGRADKGFLGLGVLALVIWAVWPEQPISGLLLGLAGVGHLWRMSRWAGLHTGSEPLVWVLHVGYGFVPLGFLMMAAAVFGWLPQPAAQHVWMAGAIGLMTLAVMTRASLGHSGKPLKATGATTLIYLALIGSVAARLAYGLWPDISALLYLAGGLWIACYAGFVIAYWGILVRPRASHKKPS